MGFESPPLWTTQIAYARFYNGWVRRIELTLPGKVDISISDLNGSSSNVAWYVEALGPVLQPTLRSALLVDGRLVEVPCPAACMNARKSTLDTHM